MRFSKSQLLLLFSVLAVILFFTIRGYKTPASGVEESGEKVATTFDIAAAVEAEKNALNPALKARVTQLEGDKTDTSGLKQLVVLWDSLGKPLPASFYMMELAHLSPNEKTWFIAGSKYYNVAAMSNDSMITVVTAGEAKQAFEKVLAINPGNLDAKNALAACYVEVDQDIMKGVGLLKEVVEKDSNNIQAIFTLGMLSMRSGQMEKAQQRFEKLIKLEPFNAEFYFYLGEVYAKSGNTKKALATYEKCKTLLKDEAARKEVETIIHKLKTI